MIRGPNQRRRTEPLQLLPSLLEQPCLCKRKNLIASCMRCKAPPVHPPAERVPSFPGQVLRKLPYRLARRTPTRGRAEPKNTVDPLADPVTAGRLLPRSSLSLLL